MSFKVIYNNELISLLNSVFYDSPFEKDEFLPIIKEIKNIPNVISFLKSKENAKMDLDNEISLIFFLKNLFTENNNLIPLFIKNCKTKKENFLENLVNFYLNEQIEGQSLQMIEDLINNIIYNISINKNIIEYIYQQLITFFNIRQEEANADTPILTEKLLLRYLKLLKFFYTDIKSEKKLNEKKISDIKDTIIRNYLYFNGVNSGIALMLNQSSNNINIDFPTLNEGLSLIFHINLDNELLNNYFKAILLPSNIKIFLIKISISSHSISVVLKNTEYISIIIDDVESDAIKITNSFKYNYWNSIVLLIEPKNSKKKGSIKLAINDYIFESSLSLPKLGINEKIDKIILFENLIGKATSIVLFSFIIENKLLNFFTGSLYGGFYKNKLLFKFLNSIDKDYCKNVQNFKEYERYKGEKNMSKAYNISLGLSNINKNQIISILCPFMYNNNKNIIDDSFGIFIGKFLSNFDGVNFNYKNVKSIKKLGGIYNLLPIAELMLSSMKENSDYFVDENILTEETLLEYFKVIKHILNHHKESIIEINNNKFFSCLGLFLEKFPSNIFTEQILNKLLEICRETFRYKAISNEQKINNKSDLCKYRFISIIMFNIKIISKFSHENQLKIWEGIYNFFKKDTNHIKDALDIPKIIILLRFYDKSKYEKFCCKKHSSLFDCNDDNEIMKPEMNSRIGKLFDIIQLYIDIIEPEKDDFNLYKILSLDLSPCLIKKVIQIYILHFINDKISDKVKEKTLINLLTNNYFEITEYSLSVSLLDIRSEIFKLLHIILIKYKEKIFEYIKKCSLNQNQIFSFISKNIIPIDEKISQISEEKNFIKQSDNESITENYITSFFKDNLFGKIQNKNLLSYYFNQKLYEADINILWGLLNSWMTETAPIIASNPSPTPPSSGNLLSKTLNSFKKDKQNQENKIKKEDFHNKLIINPFVLSFSIDFVSYLKPCFIDSFLSCIFISLKEKTQNKDVVFKDKKFFEWLIDTIYFFHNKENENIIEEKDLIPSIQKNSLELLCQIFKIKVSLKEIENKIYYIIEYSFYFKSKFIADKKNQNEIIRITRLIFEKLIVSSDFYINIITLFSFEFIFFYKESETILSNFTIAERTNSLLDTEALKKSIKKLKVDDNDIRISSRRSVDIDESGYLTERKSVMSNISKKESNEIILSNIEIDLIPDYYYQGFFAKKPNQKNEGNIQSKRILKNIWTDYEIFSSIINYYRNNIWGPEILFKTVKMTYKPKTNILECCQTLVNNYGDNKEYRNILFKKIKKLVIIDDDYQSPINKINLLYLNIILLCFSMDITSVLSEKEDITQQIIEFLIFCILASININQIEETYNYIQKKLYDTLSFGLLFLKDKDEARYRDLMFYLIEPFFGGLSDKSNIKKIFGSKKSLFKNSAIYRVFIKSDAENYDSRASRLEDSFNRKGLSSSLPKKKINIINSIHKRANPNKSKKNKMALFLRGNANQVIKNIFDKVLYFYKEKKHFFNKDNHLILFYFKEDKYSNEKDNNKKKEIMNSIEQEKKRINIFMKKLIPSVFSEIKKGSISCYLEEKKRKNQYKKIKKKLFSWNGFWSDKYLFLSHSELLKFRIKNHFCKDMSRILLSPILDLNYYLPIFSKFQISNLFNSDNKNYKICMDVEDILQLDNKTESQSQINIENYIKNNINDFNYLVSLYKYQYNNIWEIYSRNFIEERTNDLDNNNLNAKEVFELLFQNKLNLINEENVLNENIYTCCIVKPTHHIKGYITTEKSCIKFTYCPDNESKELLEKDPSYDKDMGACFGSTFKKYYKDKDKIFFEIKYKSIEYMFKRNYFYQETGLEIFSYEKKSYFLNFKSNQELEKFINDIIFHEQFKIVKCHGFKKKKYIGYCKLFNNIKNKKDSYDINHKIEEWQNNNISTFEYIMWLNIFSGRSFNDLTQYPVFPWTIINYETEKLEEEKDFRNMSIPVGMFDFNEKAEMRKETFKEFYDTLKNELKESAPDFDYEEFLEKGEIYLEHFNQKKLKNNDNNEESNSGKIEINQLPYFYGSHYSNPTYVSHYLTRIFPHASISIEIHGDKFDDPNRLFFSMKRTFETASTLKDDIRELTPEFFVLPEMFTNLNNFNLSQDKLDSEGKKIIINNVELPPWSNKKNINFIVEMRKNLEKINLKINKWVDLIFGYLQKGEKAEENNNIFMLNTYENMVKIENIKDDDEKNALMRLVEVGVTPIQILASESKERGDISQFLSKPPFCYRKGAFLWECSELKSFNIKIYKYQKIIQKLGKDIKKNDNLILPRITKIKAINKNELRILTNCNYWFNVKLIRNENKYLIEESSLNELFNISSKYGCSNIMSNIPIPVIILGNSKYIIKGGFWDGRIEINVINPDSKEEKDNINYSIHVEEGPVIFMEISKDENLLLCGTLYGYIIAYEIEYINNNTNIQLYLLKKIFVNDTSINSIFINDNLNMFATCANNEYVYLYLLPTFEIFRVIKIDENDMDNKFDEEELIVENNVFLSYCPLPCISIFINSKRIFKSYTINGKFIGEIQETNNTKEIKCYNIFHDLSFCDYIIYGTDDGLIKIRSFPEMNLINFYKLYDSEVACLELSLDKRYCYSWSKGGEISVIRDISVNDPNEVEQKKSKLK